MIKYAKFKDEEIGTVEVGNGDNIEFYQSIGMTEMDIEQSEIDGQYYVSEKCPHYSEEEKKEQRQAEFESNFLETSLGNYRLQPKGYSNAQQSMDTVYNFVKILNGLKSDLLQMVIFYPTPDFSKPEQCTEEWLVEHQYNPNEMTLQEFEVFYFEFGLAYAQKQYKLEQMKQTEKPESTEESEIEQLEE